MPGNMAEDGKVPNCATDPIPSHIHLISLIYYSFIQQVTTFSAMEVMVVLG